MKQQYVEHDEKMNKTIKAFDHELTAVRVGRANPAVLEKVRVDYYGVSTPIQQMAAVSVPEARMLVIQPWDVSTVKAIEKAILASDIGITPSNDGRVIRLNFPQLTEERRKDLAKNVSKMGEEAKIALRNIRRDAIEKFKDQKKKSEITEDDLKDAEKELTNMTEKYCKEVDNLVAKKQKEIMEI